jgi:hypothetical protein
MEECRLPHPAGVSNGRYWARTSDPQLVEPVRSNVTKRQPSRLSEIAKAGIGWNRLGKGDDWRATGAR